MTDHHGRTATGRAKKVGEQGVGRGGIEVLVRLVQHHDRMVGKQQPGQPQTLPLPPRELAAVFTHRGIDPMR